MMLPLRWTGRERGASFDPAEFVQSLHKSGDPFASGRTRGLA